MSGAAVKGDNPFLEVQQVAALFPNHGRPVHENTVYRWINHGVDGVRLRAVRVGRAYYIRRVDVDDFFDALQRRQNGQAEVVDRHAARSPKRKKAARDLLKKHGLK